MNFWLITVGEPLPVDDNNVRLFRTGLLAKTMAAQGHSVVWWTSTFDHFNKRHYRRSDTEMAWPGCETVRIRMLHGTGYGSNVSLRRMADHAAVALKFLRAAQAMPRPDLLLCSLPTIELSAAAVHFGRQAGIPVVIDVRDLWPDIILKLAPLALRLPMRLLLAPQFALRNYACRSAAAITGMAPGFVEWGVSHAGRAATPDDRDFPFGYAGCPPDADALAKADRFWEAQGITNPSECMTVCFFGSISRQFDFNAVFAASADLGRRNIPIRFVICGSGDSYEALKMEAAAYPGFVFPGWVGAPEIWSLMRRSVVGLAPYRCTPDFMMTMSNKAVEYISAGLPVISSLRGSYIDRLFTAAGCGLFYEDGNASELAGLLAGLHANPDKLRAMSLGAERLYREKFMAENVYREMIAYLAGLAARRG